MEKVPAMSTLSGWAIGEGPGGAIVARSPNEHPILLDAIDVVRKRRNRRSVPNEVTHLRLLALYGNIHPGLVGPVDRSVCLHGAVDASQPRAVVHGGIRVCYLLAGD